jgi:hypothetical protein
MRWNVDPIAPSGRLAGLATGGCLLVTGLAYAVASVDDAFCTRFCTFAPGLAVLIWMASVACAVGGAAILLSIRVRPVSEHGEVRWRWGPFVLFVLGVAAVAGRFATGVCPPGWRLDPNVDQCFQVASKGRVMPAWNRATLKDGALVIALALGALTTARLRSAAISVGNVAVTVVAAGTWLVGTGWLLRRTLWQ